MNPATSACKAAVSICLAPSRTILIKQRNTGHGSLIMVGLAVLLDYLEHGRTFPTSAPTPAMIRLTGLQIIPGKVRHFHANSPRTNPQVLIITPLIAATHPKNPAL